MSAPAMPSALRAAVVPFALPLRRRFRGVVVREGLLLHGPAGWGEWAPFEDYDPPTAARWLAAAVEAAFGTWPAAVRAAVPVNAIVPAVGPDDAALLVREAVARSGCSTVKVKVAEQGQTLDDDLARVAAVRAALGPAGRLRIDANGAWDVGQAEVALRELAAFDLEYVEQPTRTLPELAEVRRRTSDLGIPVAADESIRLAADPVRAAREGAADIVVLKATPLGGVTAALEVALAAGLPVVVSGAMDSAVGLDAGIALAAALPALPYACGLGTGALLVADVVAEPVVPTGGELMVGRHHPDPTALAEASARMAAARHAWWLDRLAAAWSAGAERTVGHLVAG